MTAYWAVFAATLWILGGGYALPAEPAGEPLPVPAPIIAEEVLANNPPAIVPATPPAAVAPGDTSVVLPTPLSFPIPVPPPFPSSSIFNLLSQAQSSDPSAVLSQVSQLLASTLPCPHLQAAASLQPPPPSPDAPDLASQLPPTPAASPLTRVPASVAPPLTAVPAPIAPSLPSLVPAAAPPPSPVAIATSRNPSGPIVPTPTIQTPVSFLAPPPKILNPLEAPGQSLDTLAALVGLQQQANLGLASLPSEPLTAQLDVAAALPVAAALTAPAAAAAAPAALDAAPATLDPAIFEFPQFGQATSQLLNPWVNLYEPLRTRFYRSHHYL